MGSADATASVTSAGRPPMYIPSSTLLLLLPVLLLVAAVVGPPLLPRGVAAGMVCGVDSAGGV